MITGKQIRAARVLLDWDAEDLAAKSGLNRETIFNIERGTVQPRPSTMEKIIGTFKSGGVEFNGDRGVNLIHEDYRILEGKDCYLRLLDEIYYDLRGKKNAEALYVCVDDSISVPEVVVSNNRIRDAGIKCRYLSSSDAKKFDFDLDDYRLVPQEHYKNSVMIVFGNKVATARVNGEAILIVKDKDQADMLRGLFEIVWMHSPKPDKQKRDKSIKAKK